MLSVFEQFNVFVKGDVGTTNSSMVMNILYWDIQEDWETLFLLSLDMNELKF